MTDPYLPYSFRPAGPVGLYANPGVAFTQSPVAFNPPPGGPAGFNQTVGHRPGGFGGVGQPLPAVISLPASGLPPSTPTPLVRMQAPGLAAPSTPPLLPHSLDRSNIIPDDSRNSNSIISSNSSSSSSTPHPARAAYTLAQQPTKPSQPWTDTSQSSLGQQFASIGTVQLWNQGKLALKTAKQGPTLTASVPEFTPASQGASLAAEESTSSGLNPYTPEFVPSPCRPSDTKAGMAPPPGLPPTPHMWSVGEEVATCTTGTQTHAHTSSQGCQTSADVVQQACQTQLEAGDLAHLCAQCQLRLGLTDDGQSLFIGQVKKISAEHKTKFITCQVATLLRDNLDLLDDPVTFKVKLRRKLTFMCQQFGSKPSAQTDWEDSVIVSLAVSVVTDTPDLAMPQHSARLLRTLSDEVTSHLEIAHDILTAEQPQDKVTTLQSALPPTDPALPSPSLSSSSILPSDSFLENHVTDILSDPLHHANHQSTANITSTKIAHSNADIMSSSSSAAPGNPLQSLSVAGGNSSLASVSSMAGLPLLSPAVLPGLSMLPTLQPPSSMSMPMNLGLSSGWPLMTPDPLVNPLTSDPSDPAGSQQGSHASLMAQLQRQQQQLQQMLLLQQQLSSNNDPPLLPPTPATPSLKSQTSVEDSCTDAKLRRIFASAQREAEKACGDNTDTESVHSVESQPSVARNLPDPGSSKPTPGKAAKKTFVGRKAPPLDLRSKHNKLAEGTPNKAANLASSSASTLSTPLSKEDFSAAFLRQINANMLQSTDGGTDDSTASKMKKHMTPLQRKRLLKLQQHKEGEESLSELDIDQLDSLKLQPPEFKVPAPVGPATSSSLQPNTKAVLPSLPSPSPLPLSSIPTSSSHSSSIHPSADDTSTCASSSQFSSSLTTSSQPSFSLPPVSFPSSSSPLLPGQESTYQPSIGNLSQFSDLTAVTPVTSLTSMSTTVTSVTSMVTTMVTSVTSTAAPKSFFTDLESMYQQRRQSRTSSIRDSLSPSPSHSHSEQRGDAATHASSGYDSGKSEQNDGVNPGENVGVIGDSFRGTSLPSKMTLPFRHTQLTAPHTSHTSSHNEKSHDWPSLSFSSQKTQVSSQTSSVPSAATIQRSESSSLSSFATQNNNNSVSTYGSDDQHFDPYSHYNNELTFEPQDSLRSDETGHGGSGSFSYIDMQTARQYSMTQSNNGGSTGQTADYWESNVGPRLQGVRQRAPAPRSYDAWEDTTTDFKRSCSRDPGNKKDPLKSLDTLDQISLDPRDILKSTKKKKSGDEEEDDEWQVVGGSGKRRGSEDGGSVSDELRGKLVEFRASQKCSNLTTRVMELFPALSRKEALQALQTVFVSTKGLPGMRQPAILEEVTLCVEEHFPDKAE